jgi:hypothetical protein
LLPLLNHPAQQTLSERIAQMLEFSLLMLCREFDGAKYEKLLLGFKVLKREDGIHESIQSWFVDQLRDRAKEISYRYAVDLAFKNATRSTSAAWGAALSVPNSTSGELSSPLPKTPTLEGKEQIRDNLAKEHRRYVPRVENPIEMACYLLLMFFFFFCHLLLMIRKAYAELCRLLSDESVYVKCLREILFEFAQLIHSYYQFVQWHRHQERNFPEAEHAAFFADIGSRLQDGKQLLWEVNFFAPCSFFLDEGFLDADGSLSHFLYRRTCKLTFKSILKAYPAPSSSLIASWMSWTWPTRCAFFFFFFFFFLHFQAFSRHV